MTEPIRTPSQSPRWSLDDLLPNGVSQLEDILNQIESNVKSVEKYRIELTGTLSEEEFSNLVHAIETLHEVTARAAGYAYLNFAENTQDPAGLSLRDRIEQILAEANNRTMFFGLWFKSLPDEIAVQYISEAGELTHFLIELRRYKPYTLSESEERVINLKDVNGIAGLIKVYEILTNGFTFHLDVSGEKKVLTRDGLTQYYRHSSPKVRADTYQELYRVYGEQKAVLSQIYSSLVRDWRSEGLELRGYKSPIAVRNLANDIPDPVVDTLLDVCRLNAGLFQRYFKLKARMLGMDSLRRYDIYAPIAHSERSIDYDEAVKLILDSFHSFSPAISRYASKVMASTHLDAQVRPGKRGGAFSYSVSPKYIPWVLVNYNGRLRDVTTLAHELGHSVHSILASNHSILTFHPPLPLGETASVFAEMLVTDRLLREEREPDVQRDLLVSIFDDAYATIERQAFISIFEKDAHESIAKGFSSDELAELYHRNLVEQFGDSLQLTDEFSWEWLTIPHIFNSPFYPYAYSFGQLLVLALYQQYLAEPEDFVPRYIQLLSYGGSADPQTILSDAGLDVTSPVFWQGGFDILKDKLSQLEKINGGGQ